MGREMKVYVAFLELQSFVFARLQKQHANMNKLKALLASNWILKGEDLHKKLRLIGCWFEKTRRM